MSASEGDSSDALSDVSSIPAPSSGRNSASGTLGGNRGQRPRGSANRNSGVHTDANGLVDEDLHGHSGRETRPSAHDVPGRRNSGGRVNAVSSSSVVPHPLVAPAKRGSDAGGARDLSDAPESNPNSGAKAGAVTSSSVAPRIAVPSSSGPSATKVVSPLGSEHLPDKQKAPLKGKSIFSHHGVWIRPATISDSITQRHCHHRAPSVEEHAGVLDDSVGVDVGHALLAFEFIDRINDNVLHHYLPMIDATVGRDLGLEHEPRLRTPEDLIPEQGSQFSSEDQQELDSAADVESTASGETLGERGGVPSHYGDSRPESEDIPGGLSRASPGGATSRASLTYTRTPSLGRHTADLVDHVSQERCSTSRSSYQRSSPAAITNLSEELGNYDLQSAAEAAEPRAASVEQQLASAQQDALVMPEVADLCAADAMEYGQMFSTDGPSSTLTNNRTFMVNNSQMSAEAQVWPNAISALPSALSFKRSRKLRAVDSMPEPMPANVLDMSLTSQAFGSLARATLSTTSQPGHTPLIDGSFTLGSRDKLVANGPVAQPKPLKDDPASTYASKGSLYAPGASRLRRPGQHAALAKSLGGGRPTSRGIRAPLSARAALHATNGPLGIGCTGKTTLPPISSARSLAAETTSSSIGGGQALPVGASALSGIGLAVVDSTASAAALTPTPAGINSAALAASNGMYGSSGRPVQGHLPSGNAGVGSAGAATAAMDEDLGNASLPRPSESKARFDDLLAMQLRGEASQCPATTVAAAAAAASSAAAKRRACGANTACPFSRETQDTASAVDLRCGHWFALAHLGLARHAAKLCWRAGFAQEDSLICPLCGDQDGTSKASSSKMLTTYSTNKDAYLGDLREDWQKPLHLPTQSAGMSIDMNSR